jgi:hypothetical protein
MLPLSKLGYLYHSNYILFRSLLSLRVRSVHVCVTSGYYSALAVGKGIEEIVQHFMCKR